MQYQGIHQSNSSPFFGIRFFLSGFDLVLHQQVKSKLVSVGAVDVGQYGPDCTLVIVHNLVFDDPICVAARRDGKTVVTSLWVDHSLDVGEPVDHTSIMYRPSKDLNGIPGANEFIMCLTGYQRQDREDIMTMVGLMGAQFSKPLVANRITHLICYKFEGEKYELAKKMKAIKLVNHRWLEDCLKAWKILPEEHYSKSGYELEIEAEAKDSEDETGEVTGRPAVGSNINAIPNLQNEIEGLQHKGIRIKEEMKSDQALKSGNQNQMDQSPRRFIDQDRMDANAESVCDKNAGLISPNQIGKDVPSTSENAKILVDIEAEKFSNLSGSKKTPVRQSSVSKHAGDNSGNLSGGSCKRLSDSDNRKCSPLNSRKSPRKSSLALQSAENLGNSEARLEDNITEKVTNDMCNSNLQTDEEKSKHNSPQSLRTPRRSSLSLRTVGQLSNSDGKLQNKSSEKVVEVHTSHVGPEKGNVPQVEVPPVDEDGTSSVVPQKRKVDVQSNASHASSKSRKLTTSAGKGIDRAEPTTPVTKTPMKSKNVSPNLASHIGDVTVRPSSMDMTTPKVSCSKSKGKSTGKSITASGTLASEMLQGIKSTSMADKISPNTSSIATSTSPNGGNKKEVQHKEQQKAVSPVSGDLEVTKSTSAKVNADNQTENSISKPTRKKSVAQKTLGSRPKISKARVDTQKASLTRNSSEGDRALHSLAEMEENNASSPIAGRITKVPPVADVPVHGRSEPVVESVTEIKGNAGSLDDETEAPPELDLQNDKLESKELLRCHPDKAEVAPSSSHKTCEQAVHVPENGKKKQPSVAQKKSFTGKTKKIGLVANKKRNDSNVAEGGKCSEEAVMGEQAASRVAGKKKHGTLLLNKSEGLEQLEEQTKDAVGDDHGASKGGKHTGKLAGRKRRGTLLLKKPEDLVEAVKENKSDPGGDDGKNNDERHTGKLTSKSTLPQGLVEEEKENVLITKKDKGVSKGGKLTGKLAGKKRRGTLVLNNERNENDVVLDDAEAKSSGEEKTEKSACKSNLMVRKSAENTRSQLSTIEHEPAWFLLSGHRLQRKEYQQLIKHLKGKLCRDSHQWSYQATHLILPDPIRRTEKFFAAAASGRWILKTDYLTASSQAGKFLPEEPYEWHKNGLSEDGAINLEAPRKWRLLREKTGHGAFYGLRIIIYGECIAPPLDTLKRVVKAGDGTILATSPPYTRFLNSGIDFAIVSPGMPRVDVWVQEFLRHEIPCVLADYLVEYVCKPGYSIEKHVQYNTHNWAAKSISKLMSLLEECVVADAATPENQISSDLACQVCGSSDRGEVMLICGDESGSSGCGIGTHIDCCDPPLEDIPEEDWFCPKCNETRNKTTVSAKKKATSKSRS